MVSRADHACAWEKLHPPVGKRPIITKPNASPALRAEVYTANRGKGYALRRGLSLAQTPYCIYTDVDLAYDPDEAVKLLENLEAGADLAVVNRAHPDSTFHISPRDFPNIY